MVILLINSMEGGYLKKGAGGKIQYFDKEKILSSIEEAHLVTKQ